MSSTFCHVSSPLTSCCTTAATLSLCTLTCSHQMRKLLLFCPLGKVGSAFLILAGRGRPCKDESASHVCCSLVFMPAFLFLWKTLPTERQTLDLVANYQDRLARGIEIMSRYHLYASMQLFSQASTRVKPTFTKGHPEWAVGLGRVAGWGFLAGWKPAISN